jgi:hypothetical protein
MNNTMYRFTSGVAIAAALILVWLSLGVGIIGQDGDPANLMYFGVLAIGIIGSLIARFRPRGMSRALFATAFAQTSVATIALTSRQSTNALTLLLSSLASSSPTQLLNGMQMDADDI